MENRKIERISHIIIKTLYSRFQSFPDNESSNRNAPFHEAFLNAFEEEISKTVTDIPRYITMSSWLHGLSTTLGQVFFESTAHILCDGEKREYTSKKLGLLDIYKSQKTKISSLMSDLYNNVRTPNVSNEEKILSLLATGSLDKALGFSADVYYETQSDIVAIELKSVKPNSGEMRGEKLKILEAKCALSLKNPGKKVSFYIGFPFDPTGEGINYEKTRFVNSVINLGKSFAHDEILLAEELWDKLSGETGTMQFLLDLINVISTSTFLEEYNYINNNDNRNDPRYLEILEKWNLFSEMKIVENMKALQEKAAKDKTLARLLNKNIFDSNGEYTDKRANDLLSNL